MAGRPRGVLCCLLAALWLTACVAGQAGDQGLEQAALPVPSNEPVKPPPTSAPAIVNPDDTAVPHPAPRNRPAARTEPAPKTPPRPTPDLQQLVGMNRGGLSGLLGKPTQWRREPPAEVWQYRASQCILHVFLYKDTDEGRYLVSHVEAVRRQQRTIHTIGSSDDSIQRECFGRVLHRAMAQNQAG